MARILFVHHAASIGGATISLRNLVESALEAGHECHVACPDAAVGEIYGALGAAVHVLPVIGVNHNSALWYRATPMDAARLAKGLLQSAWTCVGLVRLARRLATDIVHLNSSVLVLPAIAFKTAGFRVIWHVRENVMPGYWGLRRALVRAVMNRFADFIVFISEKEQGLLRTDPAKSKVVYNYINMARFEEYAAARGPVRETEPFVVLSLGGLSAIKGASTLTRAAALLPPGIEIHIVGEANPERSRRGPRATPDDAPANVRVFPPSLDVRPYLARSHALVFWGTVPHFARPVYEGWVMGLPAVVLAMCAGPSGIDSENAQIVSADDPALLAAAILALRATYPEQLEKAAKGRALARARFGEGNYAEIEALYRRLTAA